MGSATKVESDRPPSNKGANVPASIWQAFASRRESWVKRNRYYCDLLSRLLLIIENHLRHGAVHLGLLTHLDTDSLQINFEILAEESV